MKPRLGHVDEAPKYRVSADVRANTHAQIIAIQCNAKDAGSRLTIRIRAVTPAKDQVSNVTRT